MTFDVAVQSNRLNGPWTLTKVLIAGRPTLVTPRRPEEHDDAGFRYESAWFAEEFLIAHKWVARELTVVYTRIRGEVGDAIRATDPGSPADVMAALNDYFYAALCRVGENLRGQPGPTDTHATTGQRIRTALGDFDLALRSRDEPEIARTAIQVYRSTFDAEPEIARLLPRDARREHIQKINELFAEYGLGPDTVHWVHGIIAEHWGLAMPFRAPAGLAIG